MVAESTRSVVLYLGVMDRFHVERMAQDERDTRILAQIGPAVELRRTLM